MLHRNTSSFAVLVLALCSATSAEAGTWSARTVAGMSVRIYQPTAGAFHAAGRGLLIGLHGCTQQATTLEMRGNWEPAAERYGAVVALPQVPNGGVVAGCWDYYGEAHARTTRHARPLLELVAALLADGGLGLDARQVYIAGLSSGASQAMVMGCLAPDVFAGVGINAGPTVGTEISEIARVATTLAEGTALCRRLAGAGASGFETQLASVIYGTQDFVVAQGYGPLDAEVLAALYGARAEAPLDVSTLPGSRPRGMGTTWSDGRGVRAQLIAVEGMGHAFPAGNGDGAELSFVASRGPAWPMVLLALFTEDNRRVAGGPAPRPDASAGGGDADGRDAGDIGRGLDGGSSTGDAAGDAPDTAAGCGAAGPAGPLGAWASLLALLRARGRRRGAKPVRQPTEG